MAVQNIKLSEIHFLWLDLFHLHSSHTNIKPYNYCKVKLSSYTVLYEKRG